MRRANRKILTELFLVSPIDIWDDNCNEYCDDNFKITKYFYYDFLTIRNNEKKILSVFYWKWPTLISLILIVGLSFSLFHIGSDYWSFLWMGIKYGAYLMTPVYIILNLIHFKTLRKGFQIRKFISDRDNDIRYKTENEMVERMIKGNIQLERKIKLKKMRSE